MSTYAREHRERNHVALRIAHVPLGQVLGDHTERCVGLHVDLLHPALVDEVIHTRCPTPQTMLH